MAFSLDQFYRLNRRALIWIILGFLIWLLRGFFGLIFMTFILAFIATPLAAFGERRLYLTRRISIIIVYGLFLIVLVSFVRFVAPSVGREAFAIVKKLPEIEKKVLEVKGQLVASYPSIDEIITNYMRSVLPEADVKRVEREVAEILKSHHVPATAIKTDASGSPTVQTGSEASTATLTGPIVLGPGVQLISRHIEQDKLILAWMGLLAVKVQQSVPELINILWRLSGTMLLALLFSFLITLDITRLREEIKSLRASRLHDIYEQTAQPVVRFAYVLGRSFQAQAAIACVNALLTLIGLIMLGIPSLAVLTLIVFFCSFIPVLGVFISSTPIVLVALNTPEGLSKALTAVVMIVVIHAIEAYLLNPLIYGRHLKLNPVLVLLILYVGHHAFGLWGMLLGVPVAYYFIHDVFGVPVWGERRLLPARQESARPLGNLPQGEEAPDRTHPADSAAHVGAQAETSEDND